MEEEDAKQQAADFAQFQQQTAAQATAQPGGPGVPADNSAATEPAAA